MCKDIQIQQYKGQIINSPWGYYVIFRDKYKSHEQICREIAQSFGCKYLSSLCEKLHTTILKNWSDSIDLIGAFPYFEDLTGLNVFIHYLQGSTFKEPISIF